jgi:enoyl-CoA hydratase
MEMLLSGDSIDGIEAERRGWATRAFPAADLEAKTLEMAERIAQLPQDLVQLNKRTIHRQMEIMGFRNGIRAGTELCTLGTHTQSMADFIASTAGGSRLTSALQERDEKFGDYRAAHP